MKRIINSLMIIGVLSLFLVMTGCEKAPEEKETDVIRQSEVPKQELEHRSITAQKIEEPKEKKVVVCSLTEDEQDYVTEVMGHIEATRLQGVDVIKFLEILVKADPHKIRWFKEHYDTEEELENAYGLAIAMSFGVLNLEYNRQALDLAMEIIRTKRDHPIAVTYAADALGYIGDTSVIPLLRELSKEADLGIRYKATGALLALGDTDTSLPILDKAAENGDLFGVDALFHYGKLLDEKGKENLVKALSYSRAEVAMTAAMHLYDLGIEKEKCEAAALRVVRRLINKKEKDYGYEEVGGPSNPKWVLLPEYKDKKLENLKGNFNSDGRACAYAIRLLGDLRSKKAVPLLKNIKEYNTHGDCVCWENAADRDAEEAINKIEGRVE